MPSKMQDQKLPNNADKFIEKELRILTNIESEHNEAINTGNILRKNKLEAESAEVFKKIDAFLTAPKKEMIYDPNGNEGRYEDTDPVM